MKLETSPYKPRTPAAAGQVFSYDSTTTASSSDDEEVDPNPSPICRRRSSVIRVDSALKRGWDTLTIVMSIIFFWHSSLPPKERIEIITAMEPLWFFTDIALNFRTEIILSDGRSLRCPDAIAKHYVKTWFFVDLLCTIPFDHFMGPLFTPKPRPAKSKFRRFFSRLGRGIKGGFGRIKRGISAKIPERVKNNKLRKLRQVVKFLALFDVPRVQAIIHAIKYQGIYRFVGLVVRFTRQILRLHVMSLGARVMSKLWWHLSHGWPWRTKTRKGSSTSSSSSNEAEDQQLSVSSSNGSAGKYPKTKMD